MTASRRDLSDGAHDEPFSGHSQRAEPVLRRLPGPEPLSVDDRRMHGAGPLEAGGDLAVGRRECVRPAKESARKNVAAHGVDVMKGAREEDPRTPHGRRADEMVVGEMAVHDVEALADKGVLEEADVPPDAERGPGAGQERPCPAERHQPLGERRVADEAELRFHAGRDERGRLVEDDRGGAGPFLARHELQNAHEKKVSARPTPDPE